MIIDIMAGSKMYDVKSALLEKNKRRNKVTENCYSQTTELVAVVPKAHLA